MAKRNIEYKLNNEKLIIRNASESDAEELIKLIDQIDSETIFLTREPGEFNISVEEEIKLIRKWENSKNDLVLLAEVDGKIVGSCGVHGSTKKRLSHKVDIGISIEKEYWGIGIGKKLLKESISWCGENNIEKACLCVDVENKRAINLYKSLGFVIEGELKKDIKLIDGSYRDAYIMGLFL